MQNGRLLSNRKIHFNLQLSTVNLFLLILSAFYSAFQEDSSKTDSIKQAEATSPCLVEENSETRRSAYAHNVVYRRSRSSIVLPKCMSKSFLYRSNCQMPLSHMIDRVCRILFPVLFAFVNIVYWGMLVTY